MERLEKTIEVRRPLHTVYNQWTQFEDWPRFMEDIEEVRQLDDTHLHWRARVDGRSKEWDAEITEQVPDERISWRSTNGAQNAGTVRFEPVGDDRTRVRLAMAYEPRGAAESAGDALGIVSRHVEKSLENFKEFIERRGAETGAWRGEVRDGETRGGRDERREAGANRRGREPRGREWDEEGRNWLSPLGGGEGPFGIMRRMFEDMDRVFGGVGLPLRGRGRRTEGPTVWSPRVEVCQEGDELVVTADLPGVHRDDVSIEVDQGRLTLEGERRNERESREGGVLRAECEYGSFYRVIPLPETADPSSAKATMNDGVLTVRLNAPRPRHGRRVNIDTGRA